MTETQQNVDQTEIDKFSEIAAHWWDPQGQFKPLHAINPLRLSFIEEKCAGVFGKKILDIISSITLRYISSQLGYRAPFLMENQICPEN